MLAAVATPAIATTHAAAHVEPFSGQATTILVAICDRSAAIPPDFCDRNCDVLYDRNWAGNKCLRNFAAHLRPDAYSLKWDSSAKQIRPSGRMIKIAGRSFSADEIDNILSQIDKMHGDLRGVTFHFARRVLVPVRALVATYQTLVSDEAFKNALARKMREKPPAQDG